MKRGRIIVLATSCLVSMLVFTGLAAYRPGDFGHVVSVADNSGGKARHGALFHYGTHRCSVLVTTRAQLDRCTDLKIAVEGDGVPPFAIVSGNPPWLNLGVHPWPTFVGDSFEGVEPGEKISFYVVFRPSDKDPVCGMWVTAPETAPAQDYADNRYLFCSPACQAAFAEDPARFARQVLSPEECRITLTDNQQRQVLTVPVTFADARSEGHGAPRTGRGGHH